MRDLLHDKQREVIELEARLKALIAGRGGGKSSCATAKAVEVIQTRKRPWILLSSITREQARRTLYEPLRQMAMAVGISLPDPDQQGRVRLPRGGILYLAGVDKRTEIGKYRGTSWDFAFVDECGEVPDAYFAELVYAVIEPRLMDKPWAELWCGGTPGHALVGHWFDITGPEDSGGGTAKGWSVFRWDARDNPFVDAEKYFASVLRLHEWDEDHPTYVREYLGRWVTDLTRIICREVPESSILDAIPDITGWLRVLSCDVGLKDEFAVTTTAYSPRHRSPVILRCWSQVGLAPSDAAEILRKQIDEEGITHAVGDSGGIGAAYFAEYAKRYRIPIEPAEKDKKAAHLRLFADDVATRYRFVRNGTTELVDQMRKTIWNEERTDVQDGQNDHQFESAYYGWRHIWPNIRDPEPEMPRKAPTIADRVQARFDRQRRERQRAPRHW